MLVAIDQITSARTPGKKPKPKMLSSPKPARSVANATRNDTAPVSATTRVHRAKTPLLSVSSPAGISNAAKPIAESRKGPADVLAIARVTTGFVSAPSVVALEMMTIAIVIPARRFLSRDSLRTDEPLLNQRGASLVGRTATLLEPIREGRGRIRLDDTFWSVMGPDLAIGTQVRIVSSTGRDLVVEAA